jgi:hypothetical protein
MTLRPAALATSLALAALVLSGCNPTPAPSNSAAPSESATPTQTEVAPPEVVLPADALLSISMRATTDTGAAVDILLVLLKPEPYDSGVAAPRVAKTVDWCDGEIDQSVLAVDGGYSFGQLDATATPVAGTEPWPSDLELHLVPGEGIGPSLASSGDVHQVERPNELNEEGFYVPHCQQDGFLSVPGTGSLYLGWQSDAPYLSAWIGANYGATFDLWGEPTDPGRVTLSDCASTITDLGKSFGASEQNMTEFFSETQCALIGSQV